MSYMKRTIDLDNQPDYADDCDWDAPDEPITDPAERPQDDPITRSQRLAAESGCSF